jgi:hypothetical protein
VKRKNVKRKGGRMKGKAGIGLVVLVVLALALVAARPGPAGVDTLVVGELHWTRVSLCGEYHYYVQTACGWPIYLHSPEWPTDTRWRGLEVEATGYLVVDGKCRVLAVQDATVCLPDPVVSGDKGD